MSAHKGADSKSANAKQDKVPTASAPNKLAQTNKKAEAELSENELAKVSGGMNFKKIK